MGGRSKTRASGAKTTRGFTLPPALHVVVGSGRNHYGWYVENPAFALSVTATVIALLATGVSLRVLRRAQSEAIIRECREARLEARQARDETDALSQRWTTFRAELESLRETIHDDLEAAERKRRRAAASLSKLNAAEGNPANGATAGPQDRMSSLRLAARQQGLM